MSILKDRAEALRRCASQLEQIDAEIKKAVASIPSPLTIIESKTFSYVSIDPAFFAPEPEPRQPKFGDVVYYRGNKTVDSYDMVQCERKSLAELAQEIGPGKTYSY